MARHLKLLDKKLTDLAAGRIKRLIVTMPPRHGKSELCSKYFPAWYLGTNPDNRVILCSYEANFAADWGGKARDLIGEHGEDLFGVTIRTDSSARDIWGIAGYEGRMVTAGVGGPITGRGANLLIIDDPVKNARDANSPTMRQGTWDWWQSTAYTRLEPDASVLVIQTRWHEDDFAGRLIKQDKNGEEDHDDEERWEVLNLPAIAEQDDALGRQPGEALWPERWPLAKLVRRMKRFGAYVWNALFQQRPAPDEGGVFKRASFSAKVIEPAAVPRDLRWVRYWDLAATKKVGTGDPDWASGCRMGTDGVRFYVTDVRHFREGPHETETRWRTTTTADGPAVSVRIEQEPGSAAKLYIDSLARSLPARDVRGIPSAADKVTRARPLSAACERGDVFLVRGNWDIDGFIDELAGFPNAAHDDRVDSATGAYNELNGGFATWDQSDVAGSLAYDDRD